MITAFIIRAYYPCLSKLYSATCFREIGVNEKNISIDFFLSFFITERLRYFLSITKCLAFLAGSCVKI